MKRKVWLCCGVLRNEIESFFALSGLEDELVFFDSMLHMKPKCIERNLRDYLGEKLQEDSSAIIIYGDCCPGMLEIEKMASVCRVQALNCAQLLLGPSKYRELIREGAYFLLPEWLLRWREVFEKEMGMDRQNLCCLMNENHQFLVYLDTGLKKVPAKELQECSRYLEMKCRIESIDLKILYDRLNDLAQNSPQ